MATAFISSLVGGARLNRECIKGGTPKDFQILVVHIHASEISLVPYCGKCDSYLTQAMEWECQS